MKLARAVQRPPVVLAQAEKIAVLIVASSACGNSALPAPSYAPQPTSALAEVPYPPPPARVEQVPASPRRNATWIDGEWTWKGKRWLWTCGRWVVPPSGARYSPWAIVRGKDGTLWEAPGTWRDEHGEPIAAPAALADATVSEAAVVDSFGELHAPGRVIHAQSKGAER